MKVKIGFVKCSHCGAKRKTYAKIGNRIKCFRCNRSFRVKRKLDVRM